MLSFSQKAILEGVVTDQTNKPIDGVTVSSSSTIFITGPDGKYTVELNPGRQSVTFYLYGYVSQTKSVSSIDNTKNSLDVTLIEDVTVLGPIDLTDESERFDEVINIGEKLKSGLTINYPKSDLISVTYNKNENKIEEIISEVKEKNIEILDILTEDADLEDVFLKLTKKNA